MPIYEYQCSACNKKFEILQKISDPVLTECPSCKQDKLRKMVTAAAFRLKGGGWYETDFKDKKSQKNISSSTDSSTTPSTGSNSSGSGTQSAATEKPASESKPAAPDTTTKSATD